MHFDLIVEIYMKHILLIPTFEEKFGVRTTFYLFILHAGHECVWRSEDNLEFILSFYRLDPRDWTQAIKLPSRYFCPVSLLAGPGPCF